MCQALHRSLMMTKSPALIKVDVLVMACLLLPGLAEQNNLTDNQETSGCDFQNLPKIQTDISKRLKTEGNM